MQNGVLIEKTNKLCTKLGNRCWVLLAYYLIPITQYLLPNINATFNCVVSKKIDISFN